MTLGVLRVAATGQDLRTEDGLKACLPSPPYTCVRRARDHSIAVSTAFSHRRR